MELAAAPKLINEILGAQIRSSLMILIALCSSLIGATLGTRLRVFVLAPATMIGVGLIATTAAIRGATVSAAITAVLVWTVCLQLGYLGGLLTRFSLAAARLAPRRPLSSRVTHS